MKKIVLIDGNNLMFRSYYATAYNGNVMHNSKNMPTNALYGFVAMINKIINEENPEYIAVAFDIGKNFRKKEFSFYKEGRQTTPDELKMQMPIARKLLDAMGIKYLELEPYEADDIIGTLVKKCSEDSNFSGTIISSDKDLLQLINFETDIKLLKQSDYIRYNENSFKEAYGIEPIKVIDLKGLMGDNSDNIPGVKGVGEKTALKLLQQYGSLENIYENIENIKGTLHDKLLNDKDNAFMSKKIATIYCDVPLDVNLSDLKYTGPKINNLRDLYQELEFHSFLKNIEGIQNEKKKITYIDVKENINVVLEDKVAVFVEYDSEDYTSAKVMGAAVCDSKFSYYLDEIMVYRLPDILKNKQIITFDHKKNIYSLDLKDATDDLMISSYLLNYNIKDDIAYLSSCFDYGIEYFGKRKRYFGEPEYIENTVRKANFLYKYNDYFNNKLKEEGLFDLYQNIEMPLIRVLSDMEKEGMICKTDILDSQGEAIKIKLDEITNKIYAYAQEDFNISSTRQLGEILFDKLQIGKGVKNKTGYKTDVDTLEKYKDTHPIINEILEYRNLNKIVSTYIEGLKNYIENDGKIHTIFKQTIARTGRLSSTFPNLQNIPVREELGRQIRKAFVPKNDIFLSCDYSQIELRILSDIADSKKMIETFLNNGDIHAKVASDINNVPISEVTKEMRSKAKAVIFGIVYGISGFGLGDNLHISRKEADAFIEKYYELYPEVKLYMRKQIDYAREKGYVLTIFNRKRVVDELKNTSYMVRQTGERIAINTPIQGTAADIIKMAMIKIDEEFKKNNFESKMILQIHDELIFDVKASELEKIENIVKDIMENIVKLKVPLKVSTDTGDNWYTTK